MVPTPILLKMKDFNATLNDIVKWFTVISPPIASNDLCNTRDMFEARWSLFLAKVSLTTSGPLLAAVIAEIGANSFDHNLGKWHDVAGCWFAYEVRGNVAFAAIADRGQGVRSSLQWVQPTAKSDDECLHIAFELRVSGRAPEKRGNGLKFVRNAINGSPTRGLLCFSGTGKIGIGAWQGLDKLLSTQPISFGYGVLSLIQWEISS